MNKKLNNPEVKNVLKNIPHRAELLFLVLCKKKIPFIYLFVYWEEDGTNTK